MPHLSYLQITGLAFSSINPDYIYVQGVDYEVSFSINTILLSPLRVMGSLSFAYKHFYPLAGTYNSSNMEEISLYLVSLPRKPKLVSSFFPMVTTFILKLFSNQHLRKYMDSFQLTVIIHLNMVPVCLVQVCLGWKFLDGLSLWRRCRLWLGSTLMDL